MTSTMRVSPREYRLVVERLLQLAGLDRGVVVPLREHVLDAELATGTTLRYLLENEDRIAGAAPPGPAPAVVDDEVDAGGAPALLLAPVALDTARRLGRVTVSSAHGVGQLAGLRLGAARNGIRLDVDIRGEHAHISQVGTVEASQISAELLAGGAERLAASTSGIALDEQLWWSAYRRSNLALSVDTRISRRHAGATIVEPDGTVRGAVDDEIDPTIYSGDRPPLFDETGRPEERQ
jgi:hypothetical protein